MLATFCQPLHVAPVIHRTHVLYAAHLGSFSLTCIVLPPPPAPTCYPPPHPPPGKALSSDKRRKLFDDPAVAAGVTITPDHVFTFAMYQNIVDFSNYQLSLGGWLGLDLLQYMGGQPLQLMLLNTQVRLGGC